jgi:hypothetical protein
MQFLFSDKLNANVVAKAKEYGDIVLIITTSREMLARMSALITLLDPPKHFTSIAYLGIDVITADFKDQFLSIIPFASSLNGNVLLADLLPKWIPSDLPTINMTEMIKNG